ncbi:hypothetical protein [Glaciihabitans sp. dw_435]|uniref:hypothetical protein n=1 Tax=Glaciihabitans sp. dw_435 TaxID=2720081 RepID=UPI001BD5F575|nr:hypothetical protein [Glaciihabitans sp. dw_435]
MSVDPRVARRGVALLCVTILTAGLVAGANAAAAATENAPGGTAPIPRLVAAPVAVRALAPPPPARAEDTGTSFGPIEPFNAAEPYLNTRAEITAGAVSVSVNDPSLDGSRLSEHQIATIVSIAAPRRTAPLALSTPPAHLIHG